MQVFFPKGILGNHLGPSSGNGMELDVMQVEEIRLDKIQRKWSAVDVIRVISSVLKVNNPLSKFLY